jgi:hypothetical protein
VLVTDDADGFKTVADSVGVQHQVCKAHVLRNTETLIERYQPLGAKERRFLPRMNHGGFRARISVREKSWAKSGSRLPVWSGCLNSTGKTMTYPLYFIIRFCNTAIGTN